MLFYYIAVFYYLHLALHTCDPFLVHTTALWNVKINLSQICSYKYGDYQVKTSVLSGKATMCCWHSNCNFSMWRRFKVFLQETFRRRVKHRIKLSSADYSLCACAWHCIVLQLNVSLVSSVESAQNKRPIPSQREGQYTAVPPTAI